MEVPERRNEEEHLGLRIAVLKASFQLGRVDAVAVLVRSVTEEILPLDSDRKQPPPTSLRTYIVSIISLDSRA